jgi:hypothetical protein
MRLLRLYPRAWRRRYEAEMRAVLEQHDVTLSTRLDLLRGALDAWQEQRQEQRRFAMTPDSAAAAWRGMRVGLVPSAFIVAQFLLELVGSDNSDLHAVLTLMWPASVAALFLVCLRAGAGEAGRGSAWCSRLAAGAAAGLVSVTLVLIVNNALTLADIAFGISRFVLGLQGIQVFYGAPFATVAARIFAAQAVAGATALTLAGGLLGAGLAALGTPLNALARRRAAAVNTR